MTTCVHTYRSTDLRSNNAFQAATSRRREAVPLNLIIPVAVPIDAAIANVWASFKINWPASRNKTSRDQAIVLKAVDARCDKLREFAEEDGISLSVVSEKMLRTFVAGHATVAPSIVLTDGGFVRAIWRNEADEQAALIFRRPEEVQFVLFAKRGDRIRRATGVASIDEVPDLLQAHSVSHLLHIA